ncbi:MAG: adenylosuccinate lyase [Phycisphaerales bacterium]
MSDSPHDTYQSPLASRYASDEMQRIWSARHKFSTWRRIWLAVAKAQHEVTKDRETPLVTAEQVAELEANLDVTDEDLERAQKYERELRHDVMAHVHAWGDRCPKAKGIIHLGMTSQDVNDNCELHQIGEAHGLIVERLGDLMVAMGDLARRYAGTPALAFTHYQPAQPTTMGRRFAQYAYDLSIAEEKMTTGNPFAHTRGLRGATGTQASFLNLMDGDAASVDRLEFKFYCAFDALPGLDASWEPGQRCSELEDWMSDEPLGDMARQEMFTLTGQTYPRIYDALHVTDLANIAAVLHKCATDLRLLCNRKEVDEPFEEHQIGSSAMPYKRNPMRCERVCALARFVMNLVGNAYETAATQWLERTLDDSANRRLVLPEAFLATESCLNIMHNVISGLVVHEAQVKKNLMAELPFLATENILMEAVKAGGDRQHLHEVIRQHAQHVAWRIKQEGAENDLIERLREDPHFASVKDRLTEGDLLDPMKYVGRAVEQTERFLAEVIEPLRGERVGDETVAAELKV